MSSPPSCPLPYFTYGWMPATVERTKGRGWVEKTLGWAVELVERRRACAEEVLKLWAEQWIKEGAKVDREKLLPYWFAGASSGASRT